VFGPTLKGEKVILEAPGVEDLETFRAWFTDLEITRYLLIRFAPSAKQEQEWFDRMAASENDVGWKVVAEGKTIGSTAIHGIDWVNRHGTTGTVLGDRSSWRKGYGSELVMLRTAYAFAELGMERMETESFTDNIGMHRCLEKAGYQKIGTRRRYVYRGAKWHDAFLFELLREEWEARNSR
jgi:RimJ/RimL family protein N-acetyltransferase